MAEKKEEKEYKLSDLPGIGPAAIEKLEAAGIYDLMGIAVMTPPALSETAGLGEAVARKAIQAARKMMRLDFSDGLEFAKKREEVCNITTGCKNLDALLGGKGVETKAMTEVFGAYGSGKTQLGLQLAVNVQLPVNMGGANGKAAFIDTESSLPYDEKILIKSENGLELVKIGELVEEQIDEGMKENKLTIYGSSVSSCSNNKNIKAVSFDPKDYKIKTFLITGFMKHKPQKVYRVRLSSGRSVRVTQHNNLFSLDKDGYLVPKATKSFSVGDRVCVAGNLPVENCTEEIDLSEFFPTGNLFVRGDEKFGIKLMEIKQELKAIAKIRDKNPDAAYNWIKRKELPLDVFNKIKNNFDREVSSTLRIGGWSRRNNIPLILKLDNDILWFLGLYVAEGSCVRKDYGCYYTNRVIITNSRKDIENKIKTIGKRMGLNFSRNKCDIKVESKPFALFIKKLKLGSSAQEKSVPDFILKLGKEKIVNFLQGYIDGDGSVDKITGTTNCETISPYLAEGLMYSTAALGIPSRNSIISRKHNSKTGKPLKTFNIHWQTVSKKSSRLEELPNTNLEIGSLLKSARTKFGLKKSELAKLCKVSSCVISQIESGVVKNIRKTTLKKIVYRFANSSEILRLRKLVESDLWFDKVVKIEECNVEDVYDVEVMPDGKEVQNFIGGYGGIILHNTFRPERIKQIAEAVGANPEKILKNIFVARAFSSDHQILLLDRIGEMIKDGEPIKLVVIDSLTAHFRAEFTGRGQLADRQQKLNKYLHNLMKIAEQYNLAIYVTNQVMANPAVMFGDPTTAVGGHIVSHCSTYRLYFRRGKKDSRVAKMIDAPNLPENECVFFITKDGLRDEVL